MYTCPLRKISEKVTWHVENRLADACLLGAVAESALGARDAASVRRPAQVVRIPVGDIVHLGRDGGRIYDGDLLHGGFESANNGAALTQQNGRHNNGHKDGNHVHCAILSTNSSITVG